MLLLLFKWEQLPLLPRVILTLAGGKFLLMTGLLEDIIKPFVAGYSSGGGMSGLPGPSGPSLPPLAAAMAAAAPDEEPGPYLSWTQLQELESPLEDPKVPEAAQEVGRPEPLQIGGQTIDDLAYRLSLTPKGQSKDPAQLNSVAEKALLMKGRILQQMDRLNPGQGWLENGAPFIKARNGWEYLDVRSLESIYKDLGIEGVESRHFRRFVLSRAQAFLN